MPDLPLAGLLVVAIEQAVAAPFCTSRLADAGARVIKIERPEGDFARFYDEATPAGSSYFAWLNRGKESVALDLRQPAAVNQLAALIARADVLVQNLKPGALDRLGLPVETLRRRHPRLICCSITGYGDDGPLADRKAYDLLIQAESGLASITGGPGEPARVGISVVDISTGATAHAAILEALIARGRTGEGADIRISMFDVMADWLAVPLLNTEAGNPPRRVGLAHPSIAPYGVFAAKDGRQLLISIQSEREWRVFCRDVLLMPDMPQDPRFADNVARVRHRHDTDAAVGAVFAALPAAALIARLTEAGIAFAELNDMAALVRHPHLRRIAVGSAAGPVSLPAPAPILRGAARDYGPIPAIGEHTETVLAEFGLSPPPEPAP
ncbi:MULTISPECIES: CaiB/BaiF CoA-transferase family protein [Acidiphilium]|jgi:formyl-CoA transferase|uniref:L-carnitine dehydratase/bile acid-inducible protein F n=2 Tax=Acidiphilium TaxID=522 RepID=A5G1N7_ACICJ|nr:MULTISPECIES: CaiB/BaiF CoA-transferase family protein [Acidiphilium]MBU6357026.1 CoA transferase [Rhodospirillales bacterium]ABQ31769.1 L-carnitine dehydratase/bile acid-inducible protein F [Acidiphilium cryptum JF-5]KDM67234.1 putative CoA-transferase [Acidiphilium sp. JA12-A1]BAJ82250.1 putative CoA-transferase [Acidiphilium multivorum AIU301]GAN75511.1 L-carnitine dehydratase/bile acid-inducible protein F [Acidiphilium multivorum AIU301]